MQLTSGALVTTSLTIYQFSCIQTFHGVVTGLGHCPAHLTVSVPMASDYNLQFISWSAAATTRTFTPFNHPRFDISPPVHFNKTVMAELDATFNTLDGQLTQSIQATCDKIDNIHDSSLATATDYVAYYSREISLINMCFPIFLY